MRGLTALLLLMPFAGALPAGKGNTPMATAEPTQAPTEPILNLTGITTPVHDPTLIKEGDRYYLFSTGFPGGLGILIRCSKDMLKWDNCGTVFRVYPAWVVKAIPGVENLWAPDIAFWDGKFHLYYAASTFGSNRSAIGLATNVTLD
jgi:arabinan endo-1,5-alpha-L-arabinosidase